MRIQCRSLAHESGGGEGKEEEEEGIGVVVLPPALNGHGIVSASSSHRR